MDAAFAVKAAEQGDDQQGGDQGGQPGGKQGGDQSRQPSSEKGDQPSGDQGDQGGQKDGGQPGGQSDVGKQGANPAPSAKPSSNLPRTGDLDVNGVAVALLALAGVILVLVSRRFLRRQK